MEGLQLLTEKDLPYFKRMEEEGRAVIIELSIEQLLEMDPGEWLQTATESINEEEVVQWLQENGMIQSEKKLDEESDKGNKIPKSSFKTLADYLEGKEFTEAQYERVQWMITERFTEEQIIEMLILEKA